MTIGTLTALRVGDKAEIVRADPQIWISREMLDATKNGHTCATLVDDVLTIKATNRTVVYRIGRYDPEQDAYFAEWPD